ncbi:MAG: hypothetical protein K6L80_00585 [Agarilytica sp.]
MLRKKTQTIQALAFITLVGFFMQAYALPQYSDEKHTGVASCASSVCHGKSTPATNNNVLLNEYKTWVTEDRHASAYKTLLSSESKRIASNLGLSAPAHKSDICLDCHADNIKRSQYGEEFKLEDGVGCEACHGGAENWLESHTEEGVTHADNLAKNMYPTEDGFARAALCLSCHLGHKNKLVTHKIMGAGHPRLVFELESFTANQPAHYKIDNDYRSRKGEFSGFTMWAVGQLAAVKKNIDLMETFLVTEHSFFPELTFYDCHSCHHNMSNKRWYETRSSGNIAPGAVRLNLANFVMLREFTSIVYPNLYPPLRDGIISLNKSSQKSPTELTQALNTLRSTIATLEKKLRNDSFTKTQVKQLRAKLLEQSSVGEYRDYIVAEQAFYTIEGFTISLNQFDQYQSLLDKLFNALESEDKYDPTKFKSIARSVKSGFQ